MTVIAAQFFFSSSSEIWESKTKELWALREVEVEEMEQLWVGDVPALSEYPNNQEFFGPKSD